MDDTGVTRIYHDTLTEDENVEAKAARVRGDVRLGGGASRPESNLKVASVTTAGYKPASKAAPA